MIDIGQKLRKAYYDSLAGNLVYKGTFVIVLDEKMENDISAYPVYVLFTTQSEVDANNKSYFARECDMVINIINQRKSANSKEIVEDISDQILKRLFPTKTTLGLTLDLPFRLSYARLTNAEYNPLTMTESGFVISKSLTIRNRVIQLQLQS